MASRQITVSTLWIYVDYPARHRCLNRLSSTVRISEIAARHPRHTARIAVVMSTIISATVARSAVTVPIPIAMVTTIVT